MGHWRNENEGPKLETLAQPKNAEFEANNVFILLTLSHKQEFEGLA